MSAFGRLNLQQVPIILTGFGPFGGVEDNPSSTLVRRLQSLQVQEQSLLHSSPSVAAHPPLLHTFAVSEFCILDTSVDGAKDLHRLQQHSTPTLHVHLGVHGGAKQFRVEHQAYNQDDFRIPDNNGVQRQKHTIAAECPNIYQTSINVPQLVQDLGAGYCVSDDPGRFLCNHVYFQVSLGGCCRNLLGFTVQRRDDMY